MWVDRSCSRQGEIALARWPHAWAGPLARRFSCPAGHLHSPTTSAVPDPWGWARIANALTLIYYDPRMLEHETGQHPERPARLSMPYRHLLTTGLTAHLTQPECPLASVDELARVHAPDDIREVERFMAAGGGQIEEDTRCSQQSFVAARLAAGGGPRTPCDVSSLGEHRRAFCLVRPPGHHALPAGAMGFCLFGNIAGGVGPPWAN